MQQAAETMPPLSEALGEEVVQRAAEISRTGMPLAAGLLAASQEVNSWRMRRALRALAGEIERGRSLEDCLTGSRLPAHLVGLVKAAGRSGEFGPMLAQWIENRRASRQHWRSVLFALAYPLLAVVLACAVFLLIALLIVPTFRQMFQEFGLKLPSNTVAVLWLCDAGSKILIGVLTAAAVAVVALRLIGGGATWSLLITSLPLIGPPWHWTGVAEMLRCLSLLVEQGIPLGESLRLAADGIADGFVGTQCRRLATRVENGTSLTMSLVELRTLPVSIVPLIHWGERHNELAAGLRSAAEMIEGRLAMRSQLLVEVIPPLMLVLVAWMVVCLVFALFSPLISLIQGLV